VSFLPAVFPQVHWVKIRNERAMPLIKKIPAKHQPKGFKILYEDRDILVGNKAPGFLTVSALWNKDQTINASLNTYILK